MRSKLHESVNILIVLSIHVVKFAQILREIKYILGICYNEIIPQPRKWTLLLPGQVEKKLE